MIFLPNPTSKRHSEPSVSVCSVVVSTAGASSGSARPSPGSDIARCRKGWAERLYVADVGALERVILWKVGYEGMIRQLGDFRDF